ncbi:hypothetical protein [Peristeroidobacter soli]|uniref:hypothetical protein n=1 Tax=Peristeroidobacter soli TaxID=2497877 RepID=UPI00101C6AD8|nr:hypothetical protein [Peristeroidobacter soli]
MRSLQAWSGAPFNTGDWTRTFVKEATYSRQIPNNDFECFNHWSRKASTRWIATEQRGTIPDGVVLTRTRTPVGSLFALTRFDEGQPVSLAEFSNERRISTRLALGLRALHDNPARFRLSLASDDECVVIVTRYLPPEETMVLHALGRVRDVTQHSLAVSLDRALVDPAVQVLSALGLKQDE